MIQLSFCINSSPGEHVNQKAAVQSSLALITLPSSPFKYKCSALFSGHAI